MCFGLPWTTLNLASEASLCGYIKDVHWLAEDNTVLCGCEESHHPNIASQFCVVISDHEDLFFFAKNIANFDRFTRDVSRFVIILSYILL